MGKQLTTAIQDAITNQNIKVKYSLTIGSYDCSAYLITNSVSASKEFGSRQATFQLNNADGRFGSGGANQIYAGDTVNFIVYYANDLSVSFPLFYGYVTQRPITKTAVDRSITIQCLDYISYLQYLDIDLEVEGTKTLVEEELLTPVYLSAPNDSLAQLYNFANNSLADNPLPSIVIRNQTGTDEDPIFDGFNIGYADGQLKLGYPINAKYNYNVYASQYYFYNKGNYIEDVIKEILTEVDGYGKYLYNESTEQDLIDNHLTETFQNVEGSVYDTLIPNYTNSEIIIETTLTSDYDPEASGALATTLNVTSTSGFPSVGEGSINGDTFSWTGKTTTTLTGIPTSGSYALKAHASGSYVRYTKTYTPGQVWYLKYSNLIRDLNYKDFFLDYSATTINLLTWDFTDSLLSTSYNAPNISGGSITNASLNDFRVSTELSYSSEPVLIFEPNSSSLSSSISGNKYFYFTITPAPNYSMTLTSVTFDIARGGTVASPRVWALYSSIDNYSNYIDTQSITSVRSNNNFDNVTINLPASFVNLTSSVVFKLYSYCSTTGTSEIDLDNIKVNGYLNQNICSFIDSTSISSRGLLANWKLNDNLTNSTVVDCYGGFNGTFVDSTNSNTNYHSIPGRTSLDNALYLDGSNDYINCGTSFISSITNALSISCWVNLKSITNSRTILSTFEAGGFGLQYNVSPNTDKAHFSVRVGGSYRYAASDSAFLANTWYHLVGTYGDGYIKLYVNGVLQGNQTTISGDIQHTAYPFTLGANPGASYSEYFNGAIQNVRIYNTCLTQNEITELYNENLNTLYIDKRYGRIIFDSPLSTNTDIKCITDYNFYTLQASGIEINRISFRSREVENRFEALKKLLDYCPPNYLVYTRGDNKIWSKFITQRTVEDYTLQLISSIQYLEDEDLYTRVIFYGKNINPTNLMLGGGVDFVGTGQTYKATATNSELSYLREEGNYYVYGSPVSGVGKILIDTIKPIVYIDTVPIDNTSHRIIGQQVILEVTTRTETTTQSGGK